MLMSGKSGSMFPAAANATTGQFAYEPVRRWTRATRSPSRSTTHSVAPRGLSTRDAADARSGLRVSAEHGCERAVEERLEQLERLLELEVALLEPAT